MYLVSFSETFCEQKVSGFQKTLNAAVFKGAISTSY
jgi:hypothetical protein